MRPEYINEDTEELLSAPSKIPLPNRITPSLLRLVSREGLEAQIARLHAYPLLAFGLLPTFFRVGPESGYCVCVP